MEKEVVVVRTLRILWMAKVPSRVSRRRHFPWNGLYAAASNSHNIFERLYISSAMSFYYYHARFFNNVSSQNKLQ